MTDKFITKLNLTADLNEMSAALGEIFTLTEWGKVNQIGLNYRPGAEDSWHDAAGSLYDRSKNQFVDTDHSFTEWNVMSNHLARHLENLYKDENFKPGRVRFMRLMPKTGLTIHRDPEIRYHYVIKTNPHCVFGNYKTSHDVSQSCGEIYHIPCDSHWYKVDTTRSHFVYNGGTTERIHLVICKY